MNFIILSDRDALVEGLWRARRGAALRGLRHTPRRKSQEKTQ